MAHYLGQLKDRLGDKGFAGDLLIVQSNGGVMDVASAGSQPIRTALSGPAAGVMAAKFIGKSAGFENIITCDMGGTSFDVSHLQKVNHRLQRRRQLILEWLCALP